MLSLQKTFAKYSGWLRGLKAVYVINNWLNSQHLQHNRSLYKKFGIKKSIYAPIGSQDFKSTGGELPWLDQPDAQAALKAHPAFATFPAEIQQQLLHFIDEGYLILKRFFSEEAIDRLNTDMERLLQQRKVDFNYTGKKIMESFRVSEIANREFFRNPQLLDLLNFILGKNVIPFQSINFIAGSEQRAHSDSIHMTTEPKGYLIAAWIALEDIHEGNGPLFFYPGSHRLPYVTTADYPSGNTRFMIGKDSNRRYEDKIAQVIQENHLQKKHFLARKGDVLLWHANLLHGGEPIRQPGSTRKSMVAHYFTEGVICYHEMSQRPALLEINNG
jgi:hypothetical protein